MSIGHEPRRGDPQPDEGAKKVSGRNRHYLVDIRALAVGMVVHPADSEDRASAPWLRRRRPRTALGMDLG